MSYHLSVNADDKRFCFVFPFDIRDESLPDEHRQRLITDIEQKLQQKSAKSIEGAVRRPDGNENKVIVTNGMTPIVDYEMLRRRIRTNTIEMYSFVTSELSKIWKKVQPDVPELGSYIDSVTSMVSEHKRALINDMDHLRKIDGYEKWRQTESESLSDLVQRRLTYLQNPKDCAKARKLICRLNKVIIEKIFLRFIRDTINQILFLF